MLGLSERQDWIELEMGALRRALGAAGWCVTALAAARGRGVHLETEAEIPKGA